jgi:hypothetical protein
MVSRRLHPVVVFFSMWAVFLLLAQAGNPATPPMPIPLLTGAGGILILLSVGCVFLAAAVWSFVRRNY